MIDVIKDTIMMIAVFWLISMSAKVDRLSCGIEGGQWVVKYSLSWIGADIKECKK